MKIRMTVSETRYGYIDVDVPSDNPILDLEASRMKKRRAAQKLGKDAIAKNSSCIIWPDPKADSFYIPQPVVDFNYVVVDDNEFDF